MLEGTAEIRRGSFEDALRAARAEIVTWSAAQAGIEDLQKCGLRGSPTVVKRVFAPSPRAEKARQIEPKPRSQETADTLIAALFEVKPAMAADLERLAAGL
jgi:electron transfer flavoprotein beta subunit